VPADNQDSRNLLIRLDERLKSLQADVKELKDKVEKDTTLFVTKIEFAPIQRGVYAAIGIVMTGALYGFGNIIWNILKMVK